MSSPTSPRIWQLKDVRYRFLGVECKKCGRKYIGRRLVCPSCGSRELEAVKLSRRGKIYSYTVVRTPPRGRENYGPYILAIIELDDGVRVMGEVVDIDPSEVKIGMPVEVVFRKIGEESKAGIIYYGYKFRPLI
jgi:hypothetical protein